MKIKLFEDYDLKQLEYKVNDFLEEINFVADISHNTVKIKNKILYTCIVVFNTRAPQIIDMGIERREQENGQ